MASKVKMPLSRRPKLRRVQTATKRVAARGRGFSHSDGLWPMMRREAVTGATSALRCRGWHEVCVDARTDRYSPCAVHVARRPVRACVATL
eukprot:1065609-Prymnesium_polylepis.1